MTAIPPSNPGLAVPAVRIHDGVALAMFAYDLALAIDLDHAQRLLTSPAASIQRESIHTVKARRTPEYFEFRPAPLRADQQGEPLVIGSSGTRTDGVVECTLYDFGAACITYRIPLSGDLASLLPLANDLYENTALLADSRARAQALLDTIAPATRKPCLTSLVEDYVVYHIRHADGLAANELTRETRLLIAQILRAERLELSDQQIDDALGVAASYAKDDLLVIDWNAALLVQEPAHDVLAVLEYANVELVELRFMDDRLDEMLDRSYEALQRHDRSAADHLFRRGLGTLDDPSPVLSARKNLRRIAALQMDSALMFEDINNALKLLGDQYLARVYRLAAQRLHLGDWDASVLRKIDTLNGIYQKANDEQSHRRMETLEWIVIILIAFEVVMTLLKISG